MGPLPTQYRVLTERSVDGIPVRTSSQTVTPEEVRAILVEAVESAPGTLILLVIEPSAWGQRSERRPR